MGDPWSRRVSAETVPVALARAAALALAAALLPAPASAQAGHGGHAGPGATAEGAELAVRAPSPGVFALRLGPVHLPAGADHHEVAQPPDRFWEVPFDGWIVSYAPRLVGPGGERLPGRLLHHVAFYHVARSDFLCPNKEEHVFGAGGEMNEWVPLPGVGYRVTEGDRIRVNAMFHNPTPDDHPAAHVEVRVAYRADGEEGTPLRNVYPTWFDVQECGSSDYDLEPGTSVTTGEFVMPVSGRLLGVGGHLHTYGKELVLDLVTARGASEGDVRRIARLVPETDEAGRILSMPVVPFLASGGRPLEAGDVLRVTARYENPTGRRLAEGAMGIVVGYFLPDEDGRMDRFRREAR